jgi:hypothetical protein
MFHIKTYIFRGLSIATFDDTGWENMAKNATVKYTGASNLLVFTPSPCSTTVPLISWPKTAGDGKGKCFLMQWRS